VRHIRAGYNLGPRWARRELALLGTTRDDEVAAKVGRTPAAVRVKRERLGAPNPRDRRSRG
jgi:hypothetical protein